MKRNATFGLPAIMALLAAFAVFVSACYSEFPLSDVTRVYLDPPAIVLQVGETATITATLLPHAALLPYVTSGQVYDIEWEVYNPDGSLGSVNLTAPDIEFNEDNWTVSATIVADTVGVVHITIEVTDEAGRSVHVPHRVRVHILGCTCYGCDCDEAGCAAGNCENCECAYCKNDNGGCGCAYCEDGCDCLDNECDCPNCEE